MWAADRRSGIVEKTVNSGKGSFSKQHDGIETRQKLPKRLKSEAQTVQSRRTIRGECDSVDLSKPRSRIDRGKYPTPADVLDIFHVPERITTVNGSEAARLRERAGTLLGIYTHSTTRIRSYASFQLFSEFDWRFPERSTIICPHTGRSSAWLERLLWEQEVEGSNPFAPTRCNKRPFDEFVKRLSLF